MKHCPACKSAFPDFHHVCEFDGTELIPSQQSQSLMKLPDNPRRKRRSLRSLMLLTSVAVLGVFVSAVVIGYWQSPPLSVPVIVKRDSAPAAAGNPIPIFRRTGEPQVRAPKIQTARRENRKLQRRESSTAAAMRRTQSTAHSVARQRQDDTANRQVRHSAGAQHANAKDTARDKSPKIASLFKSTWKVLKKPFGF